MPRLLVAFAGCLLLLSVAGLRPRAGEPLRPLRSVVADARLLALERENGCLDEPTPGQEAPSWPDWAAAHIAGGDVPPTRVVADPYPTLHSVAVDPVHDRVFMSDPNRHALWSYNRLDASKGSEAIQPRTGIRGPAAGMMFIAAVAVDPQAQEVYTVDNDIGDRMVVFPYDADGNAKPTRVLSVPHQAWGVSINPVRKEIAVSVEGPREIVVYAQGASGSDSPLRMIRGPKTGLGDPHGVFYDGKNDEIVVANHGNQNGRETTPGTVARERRGTPGAAPGEIVGGRFEEPSITVYAGQATGDVAPIRRIQGAKTGLNWPMALSVDAHHDEIAIANSGDSSIRIFRRNASGDVAPLRVIKGPRTGVHGPMGVTIDVKNDEIWVANYGDHTALVFARTASGDAAPKRIIRNAPAGSPTVGFGNPGAVAYDSKRDEILVPNCVSEPRISAFARLANGNAKPTRVIAGQTARVSRTMHGIFYDPKHDEIVVPVALGGAVLTLPGGANGGDPPLRVLQGPHTQLVQPDTLYVDVPHDEMIVDSGDDSLLVFPRTASGDATPIRKIGGPKTHIRNIYGMSVDAVHNVIVVGNRVEVAGSRESVDGILIFNRTDNGDVEPRGVIAGPKTGIIKIRQVVVDEERGQIFATIKNNFENYDAARAQPSPWNPDRTGFIGVWSITDNGDVPPRGVIKGPASGLIWPAGVAINPANHEVYAIDSVSNALFMFHMPELFKAPGMTTAQGRN